MEDKLSLAHGSGGKLMHSLIKTLFVEKFNNPPLSKLTDSAVLKIDDRLLAFTTDTYVVKPLFFPGGDIGKLAVSGTVNDLSVMGAEPICISCGLVIEEGLDYRILERIVDSMERTAESAKVKVVTGDTKVVEKGKGDGLFINTSGIGIIRKSISMDDIKPGDKIIINGPVGEHGIAVLLARGELGLESEVKSDCAPLNGLISEVLKVTDNIKFMRDPTRGGLGTVLNEIVEGKGFGIMLEEDRIPLSNPVKGACELLGLDPLYIANEGKVVIVATPEDVQKILEVMRHHPLGKDAEIIGEIVSEPKGKVGMKTKSKGTRIVDMLVGEQLPRIC